MPEGKFCNKRPVNTEEDLKALLGDKGGNQYYEEMNSLEVDTDALWSTIEKTCQSRIRTWLEICAHCGMCADSCFLYRVNNRDPKQVPAYKIQSTLGEMVKRKGKVDNAFMQHCMEVAWSQCTCCNRCGMYCPHGIDMGVMFSYLRGLMYSQGFVPWELKIGSGMHRVYSAQMDVTTEDWVETCEWMEEETAEEWPGLTIPVDKVGADIMYTLNAREPKHYPEDLAEAAILFHLAGEDWTVPSEGWEQTSLAMFAGDWAACKMQVDKVYAAMERLKPKRMVGTECGHAHRATVIEGPYWAGREDGLPPVKCMHYVEWVAEALREGKIKIDPAKKIKEPCTLQDSCNYVRNHGLANFTREIMSYIAEDYREMTPNREHNYCCGGGGGFNGIGKYRAERNKALQTKRDQILATGATLVVAPCHNCWDAIRDLEEEYEIGIKWSFLKPLLIKMAIVPDHLKTADDE
ncbi:sulfate respiration complex iron-sulfur protein HmcF [Oleidesulfovibrio alaskensis]|jgi:Fe-S oxidoreductase|uniref:sulfate respiration complex iron-sulfur protein HmcF n=1 Tax=Oleidesulfovibrio alaskensis TaxID=58180 RepID=UPI001A5B0295|nr:(Fe-S)-binding protein [Oleidesulfovibrio alaskensis]MBL3580963.1 (Fe-S)-binding protein [Oleidesulfovibrio alaskensis]